MKTQRILLLFAPLMAAGCRELAGTDDVTFVPPAASAGQAGAGASPGAGAAATPAAGATSAGQGGAGQSGAGQGGLAGAAGTAASGGAGQGGAGGAGSGSEGAGEGGAGQTGAGGTDTGGAGAGGAGSGGAGPGSAGVGGASGGGAGQAGAGQGGAGSGSAGVGGAGQAGASGQVNCGGLAECGGGCVDKANDESNCGACGVSCQGPEVCGGEGCDRIVEAGLGADFSCALFASGKVRCWGSGGSGKLGDGSDLLDGHELPSPGYVVPLPGKAVSLSVRQSTSMAVLESGDLYGWGVNDSAQMNTVSNSELSPVKIELGAKVKGVALGKQHQCALLEGGDVRCWGEEEAGRLGNWKIPVTSGLFGDDEPLTDPEDRVLLGGKAQQLSCGNGHCCAVLEGGVLSCWGANRWYADAGGQLGLGHIDNIGDGADDFPLPAVDLGGKKATQVVAFEDTTCALLEGGKVRCWGFNSHGVLGAGNTKNTGGTPTSTPALLPDVPINEGPGPVLQISARATHVCALLEGGHVRCWGNGSNGKLGTGDGPEGDIGDDESVATVEDVKLGAKAERVFTSTQHTCALLETGHLRCWGLQSSLRLGFRSDLLGYGAAIGDDETPEKTPDTF